jgi:hypothetical protein
MLLVEVGTSELPFSPASPLDVSSLPASDELHLQLCPSPSYTAPISHNGSVDRFEDDNTKDPFVLDSRVPLLPHPRSSPFLLHRRHTEPKYVGVDPSARSSTTASPSSSASTRQPLAPSNVANARGSKRKADDAHPLDERVNKEQSKHQPIAGTSSGKRAKSQVEREGRGDCIPTGGVAKVDGDGKIVQDPARVRLTCPYPVHARLIFRRRNRVEGLSGAAASAPFRSNVDDSPPRKPKRSERRRGRRG